MFRVTFALYAPLKSDHGSISFFCYWKNNKYLAHFNRCSERRDWPLFYFRKAGSPEQGDTWAFKTNGSSCSENRYRNAPCSGNVKATQLTRLYPPSPFSFTRSAEQHEFFVDRKSAMTSGTIKAMLTGSFAESKGEIRFPDTFHFDFVPEGGAW